MQSRGPARDKACCCVTVSCPDVTPRITRELPAQNHSQLERDRKNVKPAVCQKGVRAWDEYENKMAERAAEIM